jgi:hypothetical protein
MGDKCSGRRSDGKFSYEIDQLLNQFLYGSAAVDPELGEPKLFHDTAVHLLQQGLIALEQPPGFYLVDRIESALAGAPARNPARRQVTVHIEVDQGVTDARSGNDVFDGRKNGGAGQAGFTYHQPPALLDDPLVQNENIGTQPAADGKPVGPDKKADGLSKPGPGKPGGRPAELNGARKEPGVAHEVSGEPAEVSSPWYPLATYVVPVGAGVALLA